MRPGTGRPPRAGWTSALDTLVEQDVLHWQAFPPLTEDEVENSGLARRIKGYQQLLDRITDRLSDSRNRSYRAAPTGPAAAPADRCSWTASSIYVSGEPPWLDCGTNALWWVIEALACRPLEGCRCESAEAYRGRAERLPRSD